MATLRKSLCNVLGQLQEFVNGDGLILRSDSSASNNVLLALQNRDPAASDALIGFVNKTYDVPDNRLGLLGFVPSGTNGNDFVVYPNKSGNSPSESLRVKPDGVVQLLGLYNFKIVTFAGCPFLAQTQNGIDVLIRPLPGSFKRYIESTALPNNSAFIGLNLSATTAAAKTLGNTFFTSFARLAAASAATAGAVATIRSSSLSAIISDGTNGGFFYQTIFGCEDAATVAGARMFWGLTNSTAALTNVEPSTLTNVIGIGNGASDTNYKLYYGGSSAQTPIDLGASFPANTLGVDMIRLSLYSPNNTANSVNYQVDNLTTGATTSGTLTAATQGVQLPYSGISASAKYLCFNGVRTNNATALAVTFSVVNMLHYGY